MAGKEWPTNEFVSKRAKRTTYNAGQLLGGTGFCCNYIELD